MIAFPEAQATLREMGWSSVLPLPRAAKKSPPNGYTGREAITKIPTPEDYARWSVEFRDGNTCIRLLGEVEVDGLLWCIIGLDTDAYGTKTGAQTLAEGEKRWGPLPPTWTSTSRDDGVSCIRLYRIPVGVELRGVLKFPEMGVGDVELIQWFHRYVVCWPSFHPDTGQQYRWRDPSGVVRVRPPRPGELAVLTDAWTEGLRKTVRQPRASRRSAANNGQARESVPPLTAISAMTEGRPSQKVAVRLAEALADLAQGLSRHDSMCGHVLGLLRFGRNGESGVEVALVTLYQRFVNTVAPDREGGEPEAALEFERMISNAEGLLAAEPPQERFEWPGPTPTFGSQREEADEDGEVGEDAEFWAQRDTLAGIHRFARDRMATPYAVLGCVLRRAISLVEPRVKVPAIFGYTASANLFTVAVGRSGQGKDIANGVGRDAVVFLNPDGEALDEPESPGIGSGEGLARLFKGYGNGNSDQLAVTRVHLEVNEVSTLQALADRKGHTLVGELLKAYMGQAIGFTNAQKSTTTFVRRHTYRLCLGIGTQPENADFFLSREKDGFPQRFLWLPTVDPYAPEPCDDEDEQPVPPVEVSIPTFSTLLDGGEYLVGVPRRVRTEIRAFRHRVRIGSEDVDPLNSHLMLTRLKVAFGLALLEGHRDIDEDDWRIAGQLLAVSKRVRRDTKATIDEHHRRKNTARAHDQADREAIVSEKLTERLQQRVKGAIERKLSSVGAATRRDLQNACSSAIRPEFPAVFDLLLDQGYLVVEGGEGIGKLYRLTNP